MRKTLKELQEMRVIIDKDIKETQELKKHLSERVYKSNMDYLLAMRDKNDIYQAEAREREEKKMKKLRTSSKEVKQAIRLHLIEIAQNDDVKVETVEQAKNYIIERFKLEVLRFNRSKKSMQDLFIYWLNGLALHTYYYTSDIINYLHSIGLYGKDEEQEQTKAADLYHYLIFKEVAKGF